MKKKQKIWARLLSIMLCFLLIVSVLPINLTAAEFDAADQSSTEQIEQEINEVEMSEQEEKIQLEGSTEDSSTIITEESSTQVESSENTSVEEQVTIENTEAVESTKQEEDLSEVQEENDSTAVTEQNTREETTGEEGIDNVAVTNLNNPRIVEDSSMEAGQKVTWDCVWFGSYPQSEITSSDAVYNELKNATGWDTNNNITIDGNRYRRMKKDDAIYAASGEDGQYNWSDSMTYHYFKYEPIKWRVLNVSDGQALLLADVALDNQKYNLNHTKLSWENSSIRSWLNGYDALSNEPKEDYTNKNFIDFAFSNAEQEAINETSINDDSIKNLQDKIFLLSTSDVYNTDKAKSYGFAKDNYAFDEGRRSKSSTYAKAMGLSSETSAEYKDNCAWWLRSLYAIAAVGEARVSYILTNGVMYLQGSNIDNYVIGVRPVLNLNLSYSDLYSYAGTVCSDGTKDNASLKLTRKSSVITSTEMDEDLFAIYAEIEPADARQEKLIWSSSNPEVVDVGETAGYLELGPYAFLTPKKNGEAIITAETENGLKATYKITVELRDKLYKESSIPSNGEEIQPIWGQKNELKAILCEKKEDESFQVSKGYGKVSIYYADDEKDLLKKENIKQIDISGSDIEVNKIDDKRIEVRIKNVSLPYGKYCSVIFDDVVRINKIKQDVITRYNDWIFTTSKQVFRYGIDTFNFTNSRDSFNIMWGSLDVDKDMIDKELASFELIDRVAMYSQLKKEWGGSCQGMSVLALENLIGELDGVNKELEVNSLYDWSKPKDSRQVRTCIQMAQIKATSSKYCYEKSEYLKNKKFRDIHKDVYDAALQAQMRKSNPAVVSYFWKEGEEEEGHAVIVYGVENKEAPYIFNGKEYEYKILTIDPNLLYKEKISIDEVNKRCIYFSKNFDDFIIPKGTTTSEGKKLIIKNSLENGYELNETGDGYIHFVSDDISILDPKQSYKDRSYADIKIKDGQTAEEAAKKAADVYYRDHILELWGQNWDELVKNEIYPYVTSEVLEDGTLGSDTVYSVPANDSYNLKFIDGYVNCDIKTSDFFTDFSSDFAAELLVSKDKNVVAKGVTGEYNLGFASEDVVSSINFDEVIVSGTANSDDVTITPSPEGVIIENSNGMNNITVKVSTGFDEAEKSFTEAKVTTALVKTIEVGGEDQVKIYVDKDKDGTFETDIDETTTINAPVKTTITSLKNSAKGMELTWNKVDEAEGYQIQYDINKSFKSATSLTVKGANTVSKVISGLTVNKKYYVRVRAYKTVNSKKYYAKWSDIKEITIKEVDKPVSTKVKNFVKKYVSSSSGKIYTEANVGNYVQILKGISTWNSFTSTEQKQANQLISAKGKVNYKGLYNAAEKVRKQCIADDGGNLASIPMTATGKSTSTKLTWSSVKGADGYCIYANRCNKGDKKYKWKCVKTIKSGNIVTYTHKNLIKNTGYKYRVGAYATINGKKVLIARSLILHSYTTASSPKYKNPSKVTVSNEKISLKEGKTKKVTAKISGYTKGKKISNHVVKIRYIISDPAIASISLSGTIKAKKAGSCTIWACAQNGVRKAIKVTVTK